MVRLKRELNNGGVKFLNMLTTNFRTGNIVEAVVEKSMWLPGNQHMFTDTLAQGGQVFNSPNLYSRHSHTRDQNKT